METQNIKYAISKKGDVGELNKHIKSFCESKTYGRSGINLLPEFVLKKFEEIIKVAIRPTGWPGPDRPMFDEKKIRLLSSFIRKYRLEQIVSIGGLRGFKKGTVTITFGEVAENGPNMQKIGHIAREGFTISDLMNIKEHFKKEGIISEYHDLNKAIDGAGDPAGVLIIRNGVNHILGNYRSDVDLYNQLIDLDWDKKAKMKGVVKNKNARHNLVFSNFDQDPSYEQGRGTVINWTRLPLLESIKNRLVDFFGDKAGDLHGEGNHYYDTKKCGIGFHGDSERKKVIAIRLGQSIPIVFQWIESIPKDGKRNFTPIGTQKTFNINHGDIYVMSEKATGNDWMKKTQYHLRHAAGCVVYTKKYDR